MFNNRISHLLLNSQELKFLRLPGFRARHYRVNNNNPALSYQPDINKFFPSKRQKNQIKLSLDVRPVRNYSNLSQTKESSQVLSDNNNEEEEIDDDLGGSLKKTENGYLYSILTNSSKYSNTIVPPLFAELSQQNVSLSLSASDYLADNNSLSTTSPSELLEIFKAISYHAKLNSEKLDSKYDKILELLDQHVGNYTHEELRLLMRILVMWHPMEKKSKPQSLVKLEKHLDNETIARLNTKDLTIDEILMTCNLWYQLRQSRYSKFVGQAVKYLGKKPQKLSPQNYIHYMFLLNIARKPAINMYELEYHLESIINEFNVNELGIIALGFFKTETRIRNPAILRHMIQSCIDNIDTVGDYIICALMKLSRYSLELKETEIFRNFLKAYGGRVETSTASCLIHAAHAAATTMIKEKDILDSIVNRFMDHAASSRLKDLERMLFSLMIFKYPSDHPIYPIIIDELKNPARKSEMIKYPKTLSSSIHYLSQIGIYPLEIISKIMDPNYLREVYNNNSFHIGRDYLGIECGLKIEVPNYQGPFLPTRIASYLGKRHSAYTIKELDAPLESIQNNQKFTVEVVHYIKEIIGADRVKVDQVLPHHQRVDIICCIDKETKEFLPIDEIYQDMPMGTIKYPPSNDKYQWIVINLASYNQIYRDTAETCGTLESKLRQLNKIGYSGIVLPYNEWKNLKTIPVKKQYVNDFILKCKNL